MTAFALHPFAPHLPHPEIALTGTVHRAGNQLAIAYTLSGNLDQVILPSSSPHPTRQYDLWEATCFELFLGQPTLAPYWEVNLSPSGDWNVFHLETYRQGLQEELALQTLPFQVQQDTSSLTLSLTLNLASIMTPVYPLEMGICAVIQSPNVPLTYWALTHCGPQADFHLRESFVLHI